VSGLSMGMSDFEEVHGIDKVIAVGEERTAAISEEYEQGFITEDERYRLTVDNWTKIEAQVQELLNQQLAGQETSTAIAMTSGARGNLSQMKMCVGMLGVLQDAAGNAIELPIKSSYARGLTQLEYFTATRGTRKAVIDIALKTADAGYLTRRLVDVAQDVLTTKPKTRASLALEPTPKPLALTMPRAWKAALPLRALASTSSAAGLLLPKLPRPLKPMPNSTVLS
jgi:DNA-directed RNA polymerase subunit beta'